MGADPKISTSQSGVKIANMSIATSETWRDKASGERREKTEWHRVVCFNEGLNKVIEQYVKKGSKIYLEGTLQTRKWQDQAGQDRYTTEVVLQPYTGALTMLDTRRNGPGTVDDENAYGTGGKLGGDGTNNQGGVRSDGTWQPPADSSIDDEIPF